MWKKLALILLASQETAGWVQSQRRACLPWRSSGDAIIPDARLRPLFSTSSTSSSSGSSSSSNSGGNKMSAAGRERRDEDGRRRQRKEDVVIGKTSALRDATDFEINAKSTEEEWLRQASAVEQKVYHLTEEGMASLKMLQMKDASDAFDQVFETKPNAYLWQAGIAKYYLHHLESAANLFAQNAVVYETKFGGPASEERIWRHACELKSASSRRKKGAKDLMVHLGDVQSTLTPMPPFKEDPHALFAETRKVILIARELFEASVNDDQSTVILSRAKLRSLGGNFDKALKPDLKMWKLNAWFYLGLHYDSIGEVGESKECMKMAIRYCPSAGHGDNIVHTLPLIHMSQRDWFDDDDMDVDPLELLRASPTTIGFGDESEELANADGTSPSELFAPVNVDPLVSDSIRKSITKMKLLELQNALKVRGIKSHGPKNELQERLFRSLVHDTGLHNQLP